MQFFLSFFLLFNSVWKQLFTHNIIKTWEDWKWDGESITKANGFLYQLQSPFFLVSFQILVQVLQIVREVTVKLQMKAIDVASAYRRLSLD